MPGMDWSQPSLCMTDDPRNLEPRANDVAEDVLVQTG